MNKEEKNYIDEYNVFWKSIVENEDGTLNKDQVMRELSDYSMVLANCALAYSTMTNQRISKQNTKFFEVETIFESEFISIEYYDELQQELNQKNKIIEELKNHIEDSINEYLKEDEDKVIAISYDSVKRFYLNPLLKIIEKGSEI